MFGARARLSAKEKSECWSSEHRKEELESENERLENERYPIVYSLDNTRKDIQSCVGDIKAQYLAISRLQRHLEETRWAIKEAEEKLAKKNCLAEELKAVAENYQAHIQVDRERIRELEERIAASHFVETAPSIHEEMKEVTKKTREKQSVAVRGMLISAVSFALALLFPLFLLFCVSCILPLDCGTPGIPCSE
ncbi:hypothetical protein NFI96_009424, partial [Prochilodus magdalenae]